MPEEPFDRKLYRVLVPGVLPGSPGYSMVAALRPYVSLLVVTIDDEYRDLAHSKFYDFQYFVPIPRKVWSRGFEWRENSNDENRYIESLVEICKRHYIKIVFPCNDIDIHILSRNKKLFGRENIEILCPGFTKLAKLADKFNVVEEAKEFGFPAPASRLCYTTKCVLEACKEISAPWILKGRFSSGSSEVRIADNFELANEHFNELTQRHSQVVLQEYIDGDLELSFHYVISSDGDVVTAFCVSKSRYLDPSFSTAIEIVDAPPEMEIGGRFLVSLGISGFAVIQTRFDKHRENFKLIEVNPRFGNNSRILFRLCKEIPIRCVEAVAKDILHNNNRQLPSIVQGCGVSLIEDIFVIYIYFLSRFNAKKFSEMLPRSLPTLLQLIGSYISFYKKKPIMDIYLSNILSDTRVVFSYYFWILKHIRPSIALYKRIELIPWQSISVRSRKDLREMNEDHPYQTH